MICERTYVILGMHRSSTSIVAQGLSTVLGNESLGQNIEGYYEDKEFVVLNDEILQQAGGSWHQPPPENDILEAGRKLKDKITSIINDRNSKHKYWGWKDPRTTLTIKCYIPWLINPHYICCWRSADEISKSLIRLGHTLTYREGLLLARTYHNRLIGLLSEVYQ